MNCREMRRCRKDLTSLSRVWNRLIITEEACRPFARPPFWSGILISTTLPHDGSLNLTTSGVNRLGTRPRLRTNSPARAPIRIQNQRDICGSNDVGKDADH